MNINCILLQDEKGKIIKNFTTEDTIMKQRLRMKQTDSMPIHVLPNVKHVQKLACKHGSSDAYAHKRTVNLMHA